jgi:hypothetical protein
MSRPAPEENGGADLDRLLAAFREDPGRSAILTDIDGTIAPIVLDPEEAEVPKRTRRSSGRCRSATRWSAA